MSHPHSSPNGDEPLCRSCTSFKEYFKQSKNKYDSEKNKLNVQNVSEDIQIDIKNCPLDRDVLGHYSWSLLHTIAADYPEKPTACQQKEMKQFFTIFSKIYPCNYCAADFAADIKKSPPKTESREALSQWLCVQHNIVNAKLGKTLFDCSKVNERWRDGWKDGSCG